MVNPAEESIREYHRTTKHSLTGYARGPNGLDWATQPDPFRIFKDAPRHVWGLGADGLKTPYALLCRPEAVPQAGLTGESLGILFELSMGLSAWKAYGGASWALRCNPSSGNLHPTESYLLCPDLPGLNRGVYHYAPRDHALEHRAEPGPAWDDAFPKGGVLIGLSSIHWREAWKYGERAYRYCQHDAGHALAALRYAAAALGWRASLLEHWGDGDVARLLGLDRKEDFEGAERETPDLVLWAGPGVEPPTPDALLADAISSSWTGRANRLSPRNVPWNAIGLAQSAAKKPRTTPKEAPPPVALPEVIPPRTPLSAAELFRQRRSAQAFDGVTVMPRDAFFGMLDACLPRPCVPPLDALPWPPRIHLALFVHRVESLTPGLYMMARTPEGEEALREHLGSGWTWSQVPGCPPHIGLKLLRSQDVRQVARILSCHQDIAADSCFSLGMIAQYDKTLTEGAWTYRHLFWEAGALGQVLYLESEARGLRGTGIGCYFDDEVHRLLGFRDETFQSLYHFTVGGPLDDPRLTTLPPYGNRGAPQS